MQWDSKASLGVLPSKFLVDRRRQHGRVMESEAAHHPDGSSHRIGEGRRTNRSSVTTTTAAARVAALIGGVGQGGGLGECHSKPDYV